MPFTYSDPVNPYAPTIAELLLRRGDIAATAARASGQAWSQAAQQIGQAASSAITTATDPKRQLEQIALKNAQQQQAGQQVIDRAMVPTVPSGPQEEGAPPAAAQHPYLDENGLVDPTKVSQLLEANGMAHLAPDLLKGVEAQNSSITAYKATQEQAATKHAIMLGSVANTALNLQKTGMSFQDAVTHASSSLIATGVVKAEDVQQAIGSLASLPPDQQIAKLQALKDTAEQLGPKETLKEGEISKGMFGTTLATNPKIDIEKATFGMPQPDGSIKNVEGTFNKGTGAYSYQGAVVPNAVKPAEQRPFSLDEQLYGAIAKGDTATRDQILDTMQTAAKAKRDPIATAQLEAIRSMTAKEAQARLDEQDTGSDKNQQKFEQQYRTVLQRGLSSRSGGLGLEDAKVQQANHLISLMDQNYDPKTGTWTIPRMQLNELALGLARLTSPGGVAGEGMMKEFQQRTAKGDIAGFLTYLSGSPVGANTQEITKMLHDSIIRQGETAQQNREGEMRYLRGLAPTDLAEDRRQKLEATSLNPLRQTRLIQLKDGTRTQQISLDGGVTWK